jgi:hypothetical protein
MDTPECSLYYVTVATIPHLVLTKLKEKVATNGETIHVMAENENRPIGWENNQKFGVKLREIHNFVMNYPNLRDTDIVLFTDAFDVVYYGTQIEILEKFRSFKRPLVFGAEKFCNPDPEKQSDYPDKDREFPFLNSGMFIGYVKTIRHCIRGYSYNDDDDDQRYWTKQFLENPHLIELDYCNRLFLNTFGMDKSRFKIIDERVVYRDFRKPVFAHVNGPDKMLIEDLV